MYDPEWTAADDEFTSLGPDRDIELASTKIDSMAASMHEAVITSPAYSVVRAGIVGLGDKYADNIRAGLQEFGQPELAKGFETLTGKEANEQYDLVGTRAAFDDDVTGITRNHAGQTKARNIEKTVNELVMQKASEQYNGALVWTSNLVAAMVPSVLDPINMATGMGASAGITILGKTTSNAMLANVIKQTTTNVGGIYARELAENFGSAIITDAALSPLGEEALNQEITMQQRVFNVLGSTFLGSLISGAPKHLNLKRERIQAAAVTKYHGDQAIKVIEETKKKAMLDYETESKPNPEHVQEMLDMENHEVRPQQKPYNIEPVTQKNVNTRVLYVGEDSSGKMDNISDRGTDVTVFSDNPNYVSNRVTPLNGEAPGQMNPVQLNEGVKIHTPDEFTPEFKNNLVLEIYNQYLSVGVDKGQGVLGKIKALVNDVEDFGEFKDRMESDIFDDLKNIPDLNNWANEAMKNLGYDGYHFRQTGIYNPTYGHNAVALFRSKGKGRSSTGSKFKNYDFIEMERFDQANPKNTRFIKKFMEKDMAELDRMQAKDQHIKHITDLDAKIEKIMDSTGADYDAAAVVKENHGTDIDALRERVALEAEGKKVASPEERAKIAKELEDGIEVPQKVKEAMEHTEEKHTTFKSLMKKIADCTMR